ncbi:hypothetical protein BDQ17DRAFT_1383799, partial [Cyathus striatus]
MRVWKAKFGLNGEIPFSALPEYDILLLEKESEQREGARGCLNWEEGIAKSGSWHNH